LHLLNDFLWAIRALAILMFLTYGFVILFGAPFLPTMKKESKAALDLLDLKPGQVFIDLGSGDGRLLVLAARRGLRAVGYEINPFLWAYSWLRTRRYSSQVNVKLQSFWRADLSDADGVFVFLIAHHMKRLATLIDLRPAKKPLRVVSHAFKISGQKPAQKLGALFLYIYR
jgi:SAM-dependent methyltransferase